ncbi:putative amino acid transporter [Paratrimastix pyriformis]|uniref:Amino acid transporter n=1 Tax=Paratrimastix pyriformis TaxID=342808 RepID=A0ABQ8UUV7_9EUKA|nr:putative amino acid transporter [Paratrimastix pyriformis]
MTDPTEDLAERAQKVPKEAGNNLKREIGLFDAVMFVAGSMVGSGIFMVSADMGRLLGSPSLLLSAWIVPGLFVLCAALAFGELAAMYPKTGGMYVYIKEAFSPLWGFLQGWTMFTVIQSGSITADAIAFARWVGVFVPVISDTNYIVHPIHISSGYAVSLSTVQALGVGCILLLAWINSKGVKFGKIMQSAFTTINLCTMLGLVALSLLLGWSKGSGMLNFRHFWEQVPTVTEVLPGVTVFTSRLALYGIFLLSLRGSYFAYDSWANITMIADEVRNPAHTIPVSLVAGTSLVGLLYLLCNLAYLVVLPFPQIQSAPYDRVAAAAMDVLAPGVGSSLVALGIAITTFGCLNALTLSGSRLYWQMARDGLFFPVAARLNKNSVPGWALAIQAIWAILLTLLRTYNPETKRYGDLYTDLLSYVTLATMFFEMLAILAVIRLRRTRPNQPRPYKVPGYPWVPLCFVAGAVGIMVALLVFSPATSWPSVLIVMAGALVYWLRGRMGGWAPRPTQ